MTRREKTAVRRTQIIEATLRLLANIGLSELTTRRIAREHGLSQPALFRHFRSRDELLLAVIDHARVQLGSAVEAVIAGEGGVVEQLEGLTGRLLGFIESHPGFARLLFGDGAGGAGGEAVRAALRQILAMQRKLVAELVRDGQRSGALRADLRPERAAALFVGMVQGTILQWELDGRSASLVDEAPALVAFWCQGATPRGESDGQASDAPQRAPLEPDVLVEPSLQVVDARPILAAGDDPLDSILAAVEAAGRRGVVSLTVPFRPNPLLSLLTRRGHRVEAREASAGLWVVDIVVGGGTTPIPDLRDRPSPEPLEAVLEATLRLAPSEVFVARLPRYPRLLVPRLEARGLEHELHEQPDGAALLFVTKRR